MFNFKNFPTLQVPKPRPGRCYNQSTSLPESSLHFIKNHCLMDAPVQSRPSAPVFVKSGTSELFTKIALHQVAYLQQIQIQIQTQTQIQIQKPATDRHFLNIMLKIIQEETDQLWNILYA